MYDARELTYSFVLYKHTLKKRISTIQIQWMCVWYFLFNHEHCLIGKRTHTSYSHRTHIHTHIHCSYLYFAVNLKHGTHTNILNESPSMIVNCFEEFVYVCVREWWSVVVFPLSITLTLHHTLSICPYFLFNWILNKNLLDSENKRVYILLDHGLSILNFKW